MLESFPQVSAANAHPTDALTVRWFVCGALRGLLNAIAEGTFREDLLGEDVRSKVYRYCTRCCAWGPQSSGDRLNENGTLDLIFQGENATEKRKRNDIIYCRKSF